MESETKSTIRLNIGGRLFQCEMKTLQTFQKSKLARINELFNNETPEYFFDRDPELFACILDGYRKGSIHISKDICGVTFREELDYWELSPGSVAPCCWETLYSSEGQIESICKLVKTARDEPESFRNRDTEKQTLKRKIWYLLDDPNSSIMAQAWGVLISLTILASYIGACLKTLPSFCESYSDEEMQRISHFMLLAGFNNNSLFTVRHMKERAELYWMDVGCHLLLSFELLVCFIVCPNKKMFVQCFIRILVVIGYVSFWIQVAMDFHLDEIESVAVIKFYVAIRYLTILKLLRLFYITKHIHAFTIMKITFSSSKQELKVLAFILSILVCLFGYVMYVAEMTFNDGITNAFISMYWALITLTTVGYGNYTPVTWFGHVVGGACAVCGVLVLALPIGVIASKFYTYYNYSKYVAKHVSNYNASAEKDTCQMLS